MALYLPPTSHPNYFESLREQLARTELERNQWDSLLSLSLRGLAKSTDDWEAPWGKVYKGIEGIVNYGEYVYGYRAAEHHADMLEWAIQCIHNRRDGLGLLPRGAAKTTWGNTIMGGQLIAMYPDLRVGLISNTATQGYAFSRAIRYTFESSGPFREIFGDCVSRNKWTDAEWLHKDSKWHGSKDVTLFAQGVGGAIISKRFDLILLDDILDEENTATPEAREDVKNWYFKTLLPCLVPGGIVLGWGTRWADEDLYQHLTTPTKEGGSGYRMFRRKALEEVGRTPEGEPIWESYWPEQWPVGQRGEEDGYGLLREWEKLGSALFYCAYQNDISGLMEGNVFRAQDWRDEYFEKLPAGHKYTIKQGVDLASSEKQRADFTARATVAIDEEGDYWVLAMYRDKRETGHAEFINEGFMAHPETGLVRVESQAFQSTLIQEVMRDYPHIPIEGVKTDTDKVTRARAVAAKYEAHKVHHHISLKGSEFELELASFPKGHDDMIDALGLAMDLGGDGFYFGKIKR